MRKNVFITGINGFIGGNLAKGLLNKGANVFGLVRDQSFQTFLYFEEGKNDLKIVYLEVLHVNTYCLANLHFLKY